MAEGCEESSPSSIEAFKQLYVKPNPCLMCHDWQKWLWIMESIHILDGDVRILHVCSKNTRLPILFQLQPWIRTIGMVLICQFSLIKKLVFKFSVLIFRSPFQMSSASWFPQPPCSSAPPPSGATCPPSRRCWTCACEGCHSDTSHSLREVSNFSYHILKHLHERVGVGVWFSSLISSAVWWSISALYLRASSRVRKS